MFYVIKQLINKLRCEEICVLLNVNMDKHILYTIL